MDRDKFDYYWKVTLLIVLILGMIWTVVEFRQISREGVACKSNPFIYGAQIMAGKQANGHMSCSCQVSGDDYFKTYSFNEVEENPERNQNYILDFYNFSMP